MEGVCRRDCLLHGHRIIGVDHEGNVRADQIANGFDARQVLCQILLADLDFDRVEAPVEIALDTGEELVLRKAQVDTAAVGLGRRAGTAGHLPERQFFHFAIQIPQRDIDCRDREGGDAAAADIVDVGFQVVMDVLDPAGVASQKLGSQIMPDHGEDRMTTTSAGVAVAGALISV